MHVHLVLVASAGGHLTQLAMLRPRLRPGGDEPVVWVTSAGPQRDSLPAGDEIVDARAIPPRDILGVLSSLPLAIRTLRRHRSATVVSTGSAIALAFLPAARLLRRRAVYIESATRDVGPSLTGRILRFIPGVELCTQSPRWSDDRWRYVGSVLDNFEATSIPATAPPTIRRAVVTLGTMTDYPFRRAVDRLVQILPEDAEVLWQTGCTDVDDLDIRGRRSVPATELRAAIAHADVVIAHAGTGSALTCFELGRCPVLIPREHAYGEHVDDHQAQTAARLSELGLAVVRRVDELSLSDLELAARRSVAVHEHPPPIDLG